MADGRTESRGIFNQLSAERLPFFAAFRPTGPENPGAEESLGKGEVKLSIKSAGSSPRGAGPMEPASHRGLRRSSSSGFLKTSRQPCGVVAPVGNTNLAGHIVRVLLSRFRRSELTKAQRDIRRKRRVLERAERIGNVRKTCREFGASRSVFYLWKKAYETDGDEGLVFKKRCPVNIQIRMPPEIVEKVLYQGRAYINLGPIRSGSAEPSTWPQPNATVSSSTPCHQSIPSSLPCRKWKPAGF